MCYAWVVSTPDLRQLARHVLESSPGDSLGLAFDAEAQLDAADFAAERYLRDPSPETLGQWRDVMDGVRSSFSSSELAPEVRSRLEIHLLLLEASERWQAGTSTDIDGLRACVSKVSEERLALDPSRALEIVRGLGEFVVSALWGRRAQLA